eukprot:990584-Lingulodinium_polyedra.AAC.1
MPKSPCADPQNENAPVRGAGNWHFAYDPCRHRLSLRPRGRPLPWRFPPRETHTHAQYSIRNCTATLNIPQGLGS